MTPTSLRNLGGPAIAGRAPTSPAALAPSVSAPACWRKVRRLPVSERLSKSMVVSSARQVHVGAPAVALAEVLECSLTDSAARKGRLQRAAGVSSRRQPSSPPSRAPPLLLRPPGVLTLPRDRGCPELRPASPTLPPP